MAATLLQGRPVVEIFEAKLIQKIEEIKKSGGHLCLATVQVGASKDTAIYVDSIKKLCQRLGVEYISSVSPANISLDELRFKIASLCADEAVTGVLLFAPLPAELQVNLHKVLEAMDYSKDVEGRKISVLHKQTIVPPTALAATELIHVALESGKQGYEGKEAVVIGGSDIVGKPVAALLTEKLATVTVCNVYTRDLAAHVRRADIVVSATGKAHLVKGEWIKPGAIVIDVGENFLDGKLVGDIEFDKARENASFITPVPGGVGPLTNVMLICNLLKLYKENLERES